MKTKLLVMIAVMGAMSLPALATIDVNVDANGPLAGGSPGLVESLDWNVGNAVAIGAVPLTTGTSFQSRLQGSLSVFNPAGGGPGITPPAGREWTIVAVLPEVTAAVVGAFPLQTAVFTLGPVVGPASPIDASSTVVGNTIQIYESAFDSSDLAGTGFANGTLILEATATSLVSNFTGTGGGAGTNLDQFGGTDNYPAIDSVTGVGGTSLTAQVNFVDGNYFTDPAGSIDITFFSTQQILPFLQVDPSAAFLGYVPAIGPVNGQSGPDFQFQIDANQTFDGRVEVPEPLTAGLGVMGLAGLALAALRRRSA